jgi:eukaryotic-like serine/threonine-protein kinase
LGGGRDPLRWRTALAAVQQVEDDPAGIAPDARDRFTRLKTEVSSGLHDAERDATLRRSLVVIRDNQRDAGMEATDAAYAAAFRDAGLDLDVRSVPEAARWFRRRRAEVAVELAGHLDHWSEVRRATRRPPASWRKPLELARAADADDYRDRLRALLEADDRKAQVVQFKALADEPRAAELPPLTAILLAGALEGAGERQAAVGLLRRAAPRHPDNFWVISALAGAMTRLKPSPREDAVRYYTAARALRPEAAHDLAHLLDEMGRGDEAVATFRDLVERRGDNSWYLGCFGQCLKDHGHTEESSTVLARALTLARATLELHPDDASAHFHVANILRDQNKQVEAEVEYRAALKIQPAYPTALNNLGNDLGDQRKPAEAEVAFRAALKLEPDNAAIHNNLGNVLSNQGKLAEAAVAYRAALELQPDNPRIHNNLGLVLAALGKPAEAEAAYRAAIHLKPDHVESHYNLANALERQGKPAEAEAEFREALKIRPDLAEIHCNLGLLLGRSGRNAEALKELRRGHELGSRRPGWNFPSATWLREAQRRAGPEVRLPDVLKGVDHPADADEGIVFARLCYDRKRHAAAARLYAEALRTDPRLAESRQAQHPYNAACAAALAGSGQGEDDPPPEEVARAKLRGQALAWLKDELAAWSKSLEGSKPEAHAAVRQTLEHWKKDSDLAGVRDDARLAELPAEERRTWHALWADFEALLKKARGDPP